MVPSPLGPWAMLKGVLIGAQYKGLAAVTSDITVLSGPLLLVEAWVLACQPAWLNGILLLVLQRHGSHRRRNQDEEAFSGLASLGFSQMTSPAPKIGLETLQ